MRFLIALFLLGLISLGILSVFLLLLGDQLILLMFPVLPTLPNGLKGSLQSAILGHKVRFRNPRLAVFQDPRPVAMSFRAFGSRGVILVSQGLISLRCEADLQDILRAATLELEEKGVCRGTVGTFLALTLTRIAPKGWVRLYLSESGEHPANLSPLATVWFWMVYPFLDYFTEMGDGRMVKAGRPLGQATNLSPDRHLVNFLRRS